MATFLIGWLVVSVVIVLAAMGAAARRTPKPVAQPAALDSELWQTAPTEPESRRYGEGKLVPSCAVH